MDGHGPFNDLMRNVTRYLLTIALANIVCASDLTVATEMSRSWNDPAADISSSDWLGWWKSEDDKPLAEVWVAGALSTLSEIGSDDEGADHTSSDAYWRYNCITENAARSDQRSNVELIADRFAAYLGTQPKVPNPFGVSFEFMQFLRDSCPLRTIEIE